MKKQFIVGVIHARGGSRRIPLKNIRPLNGKPLIGYMIQAALGAELLTRVVVSTDHDGIRDAAIHFGAEVPFKRPAEIAVDCPSELVTLHAVEFVEKEVGKKVDIAVTMQPTTPFCRPSDIDTCIRMLQTHKSWDSVFSAKKVSERPEWMFRYDSPGEQASLLIGNELRGNKGVFQELPDMVIPNGGIYATRRRCLAEQGAIIGKKSGAHVMSPERSVDIDEEIDFALAELVGRQLDGTT
jgi:CMP-N,N'-diacetyllegionaminic acid synthase